jgi:hypothetical protein
MSTVTATTPAICTNGDSAANDTDALIHAASAYQKPTIPTSNRQLDDIAHEAVEAIVKYNRAHPREPVIYVRGGLLTYLCEDEHDNFVARNVTPTALKRILADVANWEKMVRRQDGWAIVAIPPIVDVVSYIMGMESWPRFPSLVGITYGPVFAPDGKLHQEMGYDPATQMYNASRLHLGDTEPTAANVAAAKALILDDLLVDFPFRDEASRTHAMALLLLPLIRPMIQRVTPLHLIDAPDAGTGKGLLADLCGIVATGRPLYATQATTEDEEWRKRITTTLMSGGSHVFIDNIPQGGDFDSGVLASALTQEYYKDRLLATNLELQVKVRCVWVAAGNNVSPSREIARRSLWIRLDANAESPHERTNFKHKQIRAWAENNRDALVTAAVTLIRSWIRAGKPAYTGKLLGSYEEWTEVIGGLLEHIDMTGFLANCSELFSAAVSDHAVLKAFIQQWYDRHGETETSSGELFKIASYPDDPIGAGNDWLNILSDHLGNGKQQGRQVKLGKLIGRYKDRVIGSYKIQAGSTVMGKTHWRLLKVQ